MTRRRNAKLSPRHEPLAAGLLRTLCDPKTLGFKTTEELEPPAELVGQERALGAIHFGASIKQPGFNLFAHGASGLGKHTAVREFLRRKAAQEAAPDDWVYVNNFEHSHRPKALSLPPGIAIKFRDAMGELIDDLQSAVPALFESEEYQTRHRAIDEAVEQAQAASFEELQKKADVENIAILRTPMGFALAPKQDGKVIKPEVFHALPEKQRKAIEDKVQILQKDLENILRSIPGLQKQRRERIKDLNAELAEMAVSAAIAEIAPPFAKIAALQGYLADVHKDLVANAHIFLEKPPAESGDGSFNQSGLNHEDPRFFRYSVNVIIANGHNKESDQGVEGAPVIFEEHPTLANLVGRIEHISQFGTLMTNFTLIKAGALHRANGGYLIVDARKILSEPFAWEALKRSIKSNCITIESAAEQMSLASTTSLQPDPIPLSVKIVLIGDGMLYYLLVTYDPDFKDLFKVEVDFNDQIERSRETIGLYAKIIAAIVQKENLRPFKADGVARVIEEASRRLADRERLSIEMGALADLLREADFWAQEAGRKQVAKAHVERAINEAINRADRLRERSYEMIERDIVLVDTQGEMIGQANALSVLSLGHFSFGKPSRITARVRMGTGKLIDIEREVELGGPLHSKGVLILSSFLSSRYALDVPMSLWASLVFEQSYGGIDGDSASSAELYCLLSALGEVPIKQSLAITGSVNQLGEVQAIGGVNEKIEGFFDICQSRGLKKGQGVLIPASNIKHLMLREDVVKAAGKGMFNIYPVENIDQGLEILTGLPAGIRDAKGQYPEGSLNGAVEARLRGFAQMRRDFSGKSNNRDNDKNGVET